MTNDGALHAPAFLLPAAKKILNAGKSIAFLQQLRKDVPEKAQGRKPNLSYEKVVGLEEALPLLPFSELFATSFSGWMDSKYTTASTVLKQHLFNGCNLLGHIDNLEHIYFSKDGVLFQAFADDLLKRMNNRKVVWNDKFLLTELARRTFGSIDGIKAGSLSVRTLTTKGASACSVKALTSILLDINLPWPIQNIIQRSSISTYQSVFTFILQIYYAKSLLRTNKKRGSARASRATIGIRQQLMWFASVMHSCVLEVVVRSAVERLREKLLAAEDVDEMFEVHEDFVKKLELSCLLAKNLAPIYDSIISILDLAEGFAQSQTSAIDARDSHRNLNARLSRRRKNADDSEVESELSDDSGDENGAAASGRGTAISPEEQLKGLHDKFSQILHFTIAGLRGVSRAGGQVEWEMLAERLEWGSQKRSRPTDYV
jgi:gamma-tubulin complex component 5